PHRRGTDYAAQIRGDLAFLERALQALLAGRVQSVDGSEQVSLAVWRTSATTLRALQYHAARSAELGLRVERVHREAWWLAVILDLLSVLFAAGAAFLAIRTVLRYERLQTAHSVLLAQRAEELEQFAARVAHDVLSPLSAVSLAIDSAARGATDARTQKTLARADSSLGRVRAIV